MSRQSKVSTPAEPEVDQLVNEAEDAPLATPIPGDETVSPPMEEACPGDEGGEGGPGDEGGEADGEAALRHAEGERDEYRDALRRERADFDNYRKRMAKTQGEQVERAAGDLVSKLLSVLDTIDLALAHRTDTGEASLEQVRAALTDTLAREGLERIDPQGQSFDPTEHDAVVLDPSVDGESGVEGPEVTEVLRAGYRWKGRVLRPAMVKVRG